MQKPQNNLLGTMEPELELEKAKNEVLRKIGRNILLFQQVEHMIKFLVANGKIEGYVSEVEASQKQRAEIIRKQTLGQLVGQYLKNTHSICKEINEDHVELKEAYLSFTFRIDVDAVYYETKKEDLASLVAERNDLIHHFLPRLNHESIESWIETEHYLDRQCEKLLPELTQLKSIVDALQEGRKALAEFLNSDEGKRQFELPWLRQSRLVLLLGDIATQAARHDGWTLLSTAGQLIRQHAPEEMAVLNERYGHKTLKGLILATEIFDITEEPTNRGGVRVLYRLKPGWALQNA